MVGDVFYKQFRERVSSYSGPYAEYILLAPDLLLLVGRLMLDPRVTTRHKAYLGAALAYVISPIDLLSERQLGPVGYLDDLAVLVAALHQLVNEADPQIVLQHWSGDADLLAKVREILGQADQFIGKGRLDKILDGLGIRRPSPGPTA